HNGIVENHRDLRAKLEAGGHRLVSTTDSEVLAHLLEDGAAAGLGLADAVEATVAMVEGSLALAVIAADQPDLVVVARRGSPLVVGTTATAGLAASDVHALLAHTSELYAVGDGQVVEIRPGRVVVVSPAKATMRRERRGMIGETTAPDRGGFADFMLKEIHEQPTAIAATLGRRSDEAGGPAAAMILAAAGDVSRVVIVGCGTSLHAGLAARPALESWARLPVECEIASELRYRDVVFDRTTLVIGVSQSGETIDTLDALRRCRAQGNQVLAVTNVAGSALAREADEVLYTRAGPEVGVAATKTHVTQMVALQRLAVDLAASRATLPPERTAALYTALTALPARVEEALGRTEAVFAVARRLADRRDFFFLGRGTGYALALEGALKLKEIAYVRAEAYAAGEMKHGPIALIDPASVVVGVVGSGLLRSKMLSNIAEMRARGATVVLVAADGDEEAADMADAVLGVPPPTAGAELLSPAVEVVALQLFTYAIAKARGLDVDRPRNLAKTVTVE
ncbi:MAG: glutamine--fructose-6-phosphate transaminase (isomerizing), partial [Acidimicrobiales bacterium]